MTLNLAHRTHVSTCGSRFCMWSKTCHSDTAQLKQWRSQPNPAVKETSNSSWTSCCQPLPLINTITVMSQWPGCKEHWKKGILHKYKGHSYWPGADQAMVTPWCLWQHHAVPAHKPADEAQRALGSHSPCELCIMERASLFPLNRLSGLP